MTQAIKIVNSVKGKNQSQLHPQKQLDTYLPLFSERQQQILLEMVMSLLQIDPKEKTDKY